MYKLSRWTIREKPEQMVSYERILIDMKDHPQIEDERDLPS